jgi:hypothetical protein
MKRYVGRIVWNFPPAVDNPAVIIMDLVQFMDSPAELVDRGEYVAWVGEIFNEGNVAGRSET